MWVLGIPLSLVICNRPEQYGYLPDGEVAGPNRRDHRIQNQGVEIGLKQALNMRAFLYLNIVEALRLMTLMAVFTHVMPYLSSMGIPRSTAGRVAGSIPLIGIVGRFGLGRLGNIFDKSRVMAAALGLISLGMLAFGFIHMKWVMLPFLLCFPLGHGGSMVLRGSILREYFGRNAFGKMIGVIMGSGAIGGIIGPTLAGWVFDTLGSYHPIWLVFCGLNSLAAVLILRIRPSWS